MEFRALDLPGLVEVQLKVHGDARGFFVERFRSSRFRAAGLPTEFVQDNHSRSAPGVLRGLHYQHSPGQGKLVGALRGRIWDVAVDLRRDSPAFGRWYGTELSDLNGKLLWIPGGFAHGFCVLGEEPADVLYKVDTEYDAKLEGGVKWNDPEIGVRWPIQNPTLSGRDLTLSTFSEYSAKTEPQWK